jgi:hypothetical protein
MDNPIVSEAQKYLDRIDFIVDLFDSSYVWGSNEALKATGYTLEEFIKLRNTDLLDKKINPNDYRMEALEYLKKEHGTTTVKLEAKSGTRKQGLIEYQVYKFNDGYYMAAKGLKIEPL